jgi:hypothetical protein
VLVTGGYDNGDYLNSVELYSWTWMEGNLFL